MSEQDRDAKKKAILRMSNTESHRFTRECIQTALIYLMNEMPFDKITITSIINRSGVSQGAFYRNYTCKEDVLQAIGSQIYDVVNTALSEQNYLKNPRQWYKDCFSYIQENAVYFRLLLQAKMPPDFIFQTNVDTENELKKLPSQERYLAIALQSAAKSILVNWFQNGMQETPDEMADICCRLFHK